MTERIETGIVQGYDDWPGVFIRGDNAFAYAIALNQLINMLTTSNLRDNLDSRLAIPMAESLRDLLLSCDVNHSTFDKEHVQQITLCNNDFK